MYKNVLVTGGAGFAGSALCIALKQRFEEMDVTALDNLKRRGSELNLSRLKAAGVRFVHGDIRALGDLVGLQPAPNLIIECSAEPSAQAGYGGSPDYLIGTNLTGCYHCLELARLAKADFIFLSTSRVYPYRVLNDIAWEENGSRFTVSAKQSLPGISEHGVSEEFPLEGPRSLYGMTKLAAELMVEEYADAYGLQFIINRFGLLTGPYQMAKSDQGVVALWMAAHYFGRPLGYIGFGGTGKQVRDFLHVDDFCDLVLDEVANFSLYAGGRFNAGGGTANSVSLLELTRLCEETSGKKIPMKSVAENRPADVRIYLTDSRKVMALNGWKPRRGAGEVLGGIHDWLRGDEARLGALMFG
jgi:CDP-paratose 2-epimerase